MVDTNSDPSNIDLVIPSNDDAIRSINFFVTNIIKAIKEGEKIFKKNQQIEGLAEDYDRVKKDEEKQKNEEAKKAEVLDKPPPKNAEAASAKKAGEDKAIMDNKANAIKVSDIKELRELTNIGMMECKKALVEAKGDKEKAIKILKEKGLAIIAKRKDKSANEGVVFVHAENNQGWM
ncbi:elongation factor ts, partial [Plakobranchus ocellatus]